MPKEGNCFLEFSFSHLERFRQLSNDTNEPSSGSSFVFTRTKLFTPEGNEIQKSLIQVCPAAKHSRTTFFSTTRGGKSAQKMFLLTLFFHSAFTQKKIWKTWKFLLKITFRLSFLCTSCIFLRLSLIRIHFTFCSVLFTVGVISSFFTIFSISWHSKNFFTEKLAVLIRFNKPKITRIFQLDYINKSSWMQPQDELEFWQIFMYKLLENCEKWKMILCLSVDWEFVVSLPPRSDFISSTILVNVIPVRKMEYGARHL